VTTKRRTVATLGTKYRERKFGFFSKETGDVSTRDNFWIGFDLGGTKMLCLLFDSQFQVVARCRKKSKGMDGAEAGLERIASIIDETLEKAGIKADQLSGIGVGCPGPIDWRNGIVTIAVNLGWKDVPIGSFLANRFQCHVEVLNDVDAGVYGEYRFGAAVGAYAAVGLFPGTGIGGGCVYDGKILRGRKLTAMEVGHMKISSSTRSSGVPLTGTLESEASRLNIAAECAKLAYRGEAPELLKIAGTDLGNIRSKAIAQSIQAGDKAVEAVVREAARFVGYGVVNLVYLIGPDLIILGGGLVEALPEVYLDEVRRVAHQNVLPTYAETFEILPAKLGDDAGAVGAAAFVAATVHDEMVAV
jgi:glucokinase